jgi:hypothetical protein
MRALATFLLIFNCVLVAGASEVIFLKTDLLINSSMPFISHQGPGKFDNALALNVVYNPVRDLRGPIEETVGRKLNFLTAWHPNGEAHVTVITPPEFSEVLSPYISMNEIDQIALNSEIQKADLKVLGLGSGKLSIDGKMEETFFLIVDSARLRQIRHDIYSAFVKKGGSPEAWDPTWWFPHITIGYTKRDLHENDGITKNIKGSWDKRFRLAMNEGS